MVEKEIELNEEIHESVTDVNIEYLIPNVIDNILVTIFEDHHTVVLPTSATDVVFKAWYKGKGGIFSKDVLNYSRNKSHGKYVLIKRKSVNHVVRIISEEEELHFKTMKLIDGKVKDRPYMLIKTLEDGEKLSTTKRYINEKDDYTEESEFVPSNVASSPDDDVDHHVRSISLFSE